MDSNNCYYSINGYLYCQENFSHISSNDTNNLTIGIKTFCRPNALNESLSSIVKYNKYKFKIIIADDSNDKYKLKNKEIINKYKQEKEITLLDLKFDSGLSKGRNEIVKNCNTKYLMILDDSRYFDNNLQIKEIINFLEENDYNLFFGGIKNRISGGNNYTCLFDKINENEIKCKSKKKINNKIFSNLYETNLGLNVFIAETNSLKETLWRDELKLGEHEIFFQDYYKKGFKCVYSPDVQFIQVSDENKKYDKEFIKYRNRFTPKNMIKIKF